MKIATNWAMKIGLAKDGERISPVFDAARHFVVVTAGTSGVESSREVLIAETDPIVKTRSVVGLGVKVVICGALSWPLEAILVAAGVEVIANTCGQLDEILASYMAGRLKEHDFLMPGCPGRQHRSRHRNMRW
ncbi:hypothetical protein JXQ70_00195 [bacterium]|nr:hypothetical protein [bacterium]